MPLSAGTRIGPYEIVSPLGAGGMGEVYRANDTKLDRQVALKVLPAALANDEQYMARFQREAKVLASLNHPNIAALYGLEESGEVRALVMELVEGQTLGERIAQGALPMEQTAKLCRQMADAFEYAHDKGVVHRDLKPANVKITPEGVLKVLDFGLAKVAQETVAAGNPDTSPTLTLAATRIGVILGTAAYMSPEQASGIAVDRRADIWSFGVVLWEMLTGARLFAAQTVSHTLAAVLTMEIPWEKLPAATPPSVARLLRRCLVREEKQRLRDIGEARVCMGDYLAHPAAEAGPAMPVPKRRMLPWVALAVVSVMAAALAGVLLLQKPVEQPTIRMQVHPIYGENFTVAIPMISPDGRKLAYTALAAGGKSQIRIRSLDSVTTQALPETDNALFSFWSPDSRWLGFFADGKLKKIDVTGGPPQTLCGATRRQATGTWSRADVIVFRDGSELKQVSAAGGVPASLVIPDPNRGETVVDFPQFLPDGRRFLYLAQGKEGGIYWGSLDSKNPKERNLVQAGASGAVFAPGAGGTGRLLFLREGTLMAQPFDPGKLQLSGDPVPVVQSISSFLSAPMVSASDNGVLAYSTGSRTLHTQLSWFSREGRSVSNVGAPGRNFFPALSPDEKRVAVSVGDSSNPADLWIHDTGSGAFTRLTFDPGFDGYPVWSPDGQRIVFYALRGGKPDLYIKAASGAGEDEPLYQSPHSKLPTDWSRDGHFLLFSENDPKSKHDLWTLEMGKREATLFLKTESNEMQGQFSPDGRWMAYISDESKDFQVYVRSFPPTGGRWQVSLAGGTQPRWRSDGKELFFLSPDNKVMAVPVKLGATLEPGTPKELFLSRIYSTEVLFAFQYAVSRDGQRFLINSTVGEGKQDPITVVVNWR